MKRLFDICAALLGLVLLSPLLLLIAACVKLRDFGPIFYRQERVGRFGKIFRIIKFRSMVLDADKVGALVTRDRDPRITSIGRVLRKAKLDELPQLWNVLMGEMSFVGPRPEVPRYVAHYTPEQRAILDYRPGITDMATLLFRNEEQLLKEVDDVERFYIEHCIPKKLELNFRYLRKANVFSDLAIIAQTLLPYWVIVFLLYSVVLMGSLGMAYFVRFEGLPPSGELVGLRLKVTIMVAMQLLFLTWRGHTRGLLSYFGALEMRSTALRLLGAALICMIVWIGSSGSIMPPRSVIITDTFVAFAFIVFVRFWFRLARDRYLAPEQDKTLKPRRIVLIGANDLAARFIHDQRISGNTTFEIVGLFDDDPASWHKSVHGVEIIGMPEQALSAEWKNRFDEAVLTIEDSTDRIAAITRAFRHADLELKKLVTGLISIESATYTNAAKA